jgi:hypothetical protein
MNCDPWMQGTELYSILANACALCRGSCCIPGGNHALQKADAFLRYMDNHPELQPPQILEEYLSRLPNES